MQHPFEVLVVFVLVKLLITVPQSINERLSSSLQLHVLQLKQFVFLKKVQFIHKQSINAEIKANTPSKIAAITNVVLAIIVAPTKNSEKNANPTNIGQ